MAAIASRKTGFLAALDEPRAVYSLLFLYCALHMILRMGLGANFSHAEAAQVLFGQSFQWAYRAGERPLANWLGYGAMAAGARPALFLLKYAAMGLGFFALFDAGRAILGDVRLAAFATFATVTGYTLGYLAHADMMSGTFTVALCCGFVWAAVQALTRGARGDYLVLGFVTAAGVLCDYAFLALPAAFAIGVALTPGMRVRPRQLLSSALLAFVIIAASAWMAFSNPQPLTFPAAASQAFAPAKGAGNYALAIVFFTLPFVLVFAVAFPQALRALPQGEAQDRRWLRVLGFTILIAAVLLFAAAGLTQSGKFEPARIAPALILLPLWLFLRAKISGWDERGGRILLWSVVALVAIAAIARVAAFELGASYCKNCGDYWPAQRFATSVAQAGFSGGTIVAPSTDLGADLKQWFADSRVVVPGVAPNVFGAARGQQCLVVWRGSGGIPKAQSDYLRDTMGATVGANALRGDVEAMLLTSKTRRDRLSFALVPAGSGACN